MLVLITYDVNTEDPAGRKRPRQIPASALSLPLREAWIEIGTSRPPWTSGRRRSPHGERGLKYVPASLSPWTGPSLPLRGAWIEIGSGMQSMTSRRSRSPYGERGLKCVVEVGVRLYHLVAPLTGSVD